MRKVYLDYNATAPIRPEASDAVAYALTIGGNPSSVHGAGRAARAVVEIARGAVAVLAGADPENLVFTSGGTEANALAIESAVAGGQVRRIILSTIEHGSVVESARATGLPVDMMPVDRLGVADLDWLQQRLASWSAADGRPFLALMLANNETGVIQPVAEAAALVRELDGLVHVDAIQAAGKIALDLDALGADTLALSAHKLGGPQGVGALAFTRRAAVHRRLHGGGQERGLRGGTENVPGIAGFGAAAQNSAGDLSAGNLIPHAEESAAGGPRSTHGPTSASFEARPYGLAPQDEEGRRDQERWRDASAERLKAAGAVVAGEGAPRLANTLCFAVEDWTSALQVMALDVDGVMVSAGSACSSGKVKPSGVLTAMGYGRLAEGALRASGGWATTEEDWMRFADVWLAAHARHAARRSPAPRKEYA